MAAFLDICRFLPTAGGTTDWTYAAVVQGYQSPAAAGASNGRLYKYRAESSDLTQWEVGEGAYNASTGSFARTTILFTSAGTTAKVSFSAAPQVAIVGLKEDLISVEEANSFTATQQTQARGNIAAAASPSAWTRTVLTSGSGTYTTKAGCKAIFVRMVAGGGGGGGGGASPSGATGGAGTATSFGTSLLGCSGGGGGGGAGNAWQAGGTASGGDVNIQGGYSQAAPGAGGASSVYQGAIGGSSMLGFGGGGGWPGQPGSGGTGYGGGGGGGGSDNASPSHGGSGGAGGGGLEKLIVGPAASYAYSVGTGGSGGSAGGGNAAAAGGLGGAGIIIIDEYY
jgi:hypothetical protein